VFVEGAGAQRLFGQLSLLWALVHAGRGDQEAAAWDYAMACSFLEPLESLDLARYGAAGATLTRARESWATLAPIEFGKGEPPAGAALPRTLDRSPMALPPSLRDLCLDELVSMSVTIDTTGRPVRARVVPEIDSMLAFAALRSLRSWRFSPAEVDGEPVASVHPVHLTTKTRGGSCGGR
jgi:hypothetical protein